MLNTREEIEHWHLRTLSSWLTVALGILSSIGILAGLVALAIEPARGALILVASADCLVSAVLIWRLIKAWKRLEALEKFIP